MTFSTGVCFWLCVPTLFLLSTMYWADWGNHPKIETAAMDGTLRQTLVHENIQWPTGQCCISIVLFILILTWTKIKSYFSASSCCTFTALRHSLLFQLNCPDSICFHSVSTGLAVDYFNERLYWADAKLSVIGSVRLDGTDPVISVSGVKNSWVLSTLKTVWNMKVRKSGINVMHADVPLFDPFLSFFLISRPAPSIQHRYLWGLHIWSHLYQ